MNETQQIELYLGNHLEPQERILLDARCIIDPEFNDKLIWQQRTYGLINRFGRKKLRAEIETVQERLFSESKFSLFRNTIKNIFNQQP